MLESVVTGAVGGIVAALAVGVMSMAYNRLARVSKAVVELKHQELFSRPGIRLGLLHCWNHDGQCINRVYRPKRRAGTAWTASVFHPKNMGFQYKWFIDYREPSSSQRVMSELLQTGFLHVGEGVGQPNRIWIVDEAQPKAQDLSKKNITNNMFYPE